MKNSTKDLALVGVFVAIIIILSQIAIPMPTGIPITLQTIAVALCGYILGVKRGAICILIYITMGIFGLPVFANFKSGLTALTGLTGGFIFGFIPLVLCCGFGKKFKGNYFNIALAILIGGVGLIFCHLFGIVQFSYLSGNGFIKAMLTVSVPYLIKDIISIVIAYFVYVAFEKIEKKIKI